jgi:hypothetical protein
MECGQIVGTVLVILSAFGGIAGIVGVAGWARAERIRTEAHAGRHAAPAAPQDAVLIELKALKRQIAEMQSTGHQFDLSFDAALGRLENRVDRLETKAAATTEEALQRVGLR